ncbi:hypothetical protein [Nocardia grenadensis]|uniref:hypothetical protein n=1 Tax=Nocardia grenadensis TaxID=931537 RepID=UPI003D70E3FD
MSYTAKQLEAVLSGLEIPQSYTWTNSRGVEVVESFTFDGWNGIQEYFEMDESRHVLLDGIGVLTVVSIDEADAGDGQDTDMIFRVTDSDGNDRLFQKVGYYSSYGGFEWDGRFFEVEPYEETVTRYRKVNA